MPSGVYQRHPKPTINRLLDSVAFDWVTECWISTIHVGKGGYSEIRHKGQKTGMHRFAYEHFIGPITKDLEIDHLCKNPACCNPLHLDPVTPRENNRRSRSPWGLNMRKIECLRGHPFTPENTYIYKGRRCCRQCIRIYKARHAARRDNTTNAQTNE